MTQPLRLLLCLFVAAPLPAATWFVDNVAGKDEYDGHAAQPDGQGHGPLRTLAAARQRLQTCDRLELANTGQPYREELLLGRGGKPGEPLVVDGHGATIDGLGPVPAAAWQAEPDGTVSTPFKTFANKLERVATETTWIGSPQIWFVDGRPAPNATSRQALPPGGFYWDKKAHRLYFRPPTGKVLADLKVEIPLRGTGLGVYADWVVVRNVRSIHSLNDGFGTSAAQGLVFQHLIAEDNCDQGFSAHGGTSQIVEDCVFRANAGSGICDVGSSVTIYRRCVVSDNTYESGAFFLEDGFHLMEACRLERNADGPQVMTSGEGVVHLIGCLIRGRDGNDTPLVQAGGPVWIERCTLLDGRVGVEVLARGGLTLNGSILARQSGAALSLTPGAETRLKADRNAYQLGTLSRAGRAYQAGDWAAWQKDTAQDAHSLATDPALDTQGGLPPGSALRRAGEGGKPIGADLARLPR